MLKSDQGCSLHRLNNKPVMKNTRSLPTRPSLRGLVLAVAVTTLSSNVVTASPYATSLTNNGDGSISFRLNQTTGTNDTVLVISGGGATTNILQAPSADTNNFLARGLITTNIGIASNTVFQVRIKHTGTGLITTNSPKVLTGTPRGIAVNSRPASPY